MTEEDINFDLSAKKKKKKKKTPFDPDGGEVAEVDIELSSFISTVLITFSSRRIPLQQLLRRRLR